MRSKYLGPEHWAKIKEKLRSDFDIYDVEFTLKKLLSLKVGDHKEYILEI